LFFVGTKINKKTKIKLKIIKQYCSFTRSTEFLFRKFSKVT